MREFEREEETLRRHRQEAEEAADALETAISLAGLPQLPGLVPLFTASGLRNGGHVHLGGCNAKTALALAKWITAHARCTGRLVDGESRHLLSLLLSDLGATPALPADGAYVVRREQP